MAESRRRRRRAITAPGRPRRRTRAPQQGVLITPETENLFEGITSTIQRNPPQNEFRADSAYLHVSDLVYKCTRMIALSRHLSLPIRGEAVMDSRGLTFQIGRAVQDFVTKRLMLNAPELLWGWWSCHCGQMMDVAGKTYAQIREEEALCPSCGGPHINYEETVWVDPARNITGSVDLVLHLPTGHFYPIEVKSIVGTRWADIERPLPEHLIQSMFYWNLMHAAGLPMLDQYSVLYVKKEMVFASPYKELFVTPSDHQTRLADFLEEAAELKQFLETEEEDDLPPRTVCSNPLSPGAKKCPFALQCFALEPMPERNDD